jgi:single-strand DNA-binding protein
MSDVVTIVASGRLGRDAELKSLESGPLLTWSMASDTGKDQTTWFRCSLFGKRGTALAQYLVKGVKVVVSGRLKVREYQSKDGETKTSVEIDVQDLSFASSKKETSSASPESEGRSLGTKRYGTSGHGANAKHTAPKEPDYDLELSEDDIPF